MSNRTESPARVEGTEEHLIWHYSMLYQPVWVSLKANGVGTSDHFHTKRSAFFCDIATALCWILAVPVNTLRRGSPSKIGGFACVDLGLQTEPVWTHGRYRARSWPRHRPLAFH